MCLFLSGRAEWKVSVTEEDRQEITLFNILEQSRLIGELEVFYDSAAQFSFVAHFVETCIMYHYNMCDDCMHQKSCASSSEN